MLSFSTSSRKVFEVIFGSKNVDPQKTHNIAILLKKCREFDLAFEQLSGLEYLTDYAVELRYPDTFYVPNPDEAIEAAENAKRVKALVLKLLGKSSE